MYLGAIELKKVKAFEDLKFNFQRPDGGYAGWTVIVGGNSSGKSTLLKSAALALMGPDYGNQILRDIRGWIKHGEKQATVIATVVKDADFDSFKVKGKFPPTTFPAEVRWEQPKPDDVPIFREAPLPKNKRISSAGRGLWHPNSEGWFRAGYGPMRRLSGSSSESMRYSAAGGVVSRFVTLFHEDAALSESEEWLKKMHARTLEVNRPNRQETLDLLEGVKGLLNDGLLPLGMKISRLSIDEVFISGSTGVELPMQDISDGCRSIYATVLDLVHIIYEVYKGKNIFDKNDAGQTVINKPGVVIIDEIEAHLHPAWQREVPYWLKTHFPNIQFIVGTHSPLVVQAADPNGIFLLPLQNEASRIPRQLSKEEYEKVRWGSAHKTLLGVAFGLSSIRSRWANQQVEKWTLLNAKKEAGVNLTTQERQEHKTLERELTANLELFSEAQVP